MTVLDGSCNQLGDWSWGDEISAWFFDGNWLMKDVDQQDKQQKVHRWALAGLFLAVDTVRFWPRLDQLGAQHQHQESQESPR